jgi:hypothetical protein
VDHGQGYGTKERRKKETGQDAGGKAGRKKGKETSQGLIGDIPGRIRGSSDDPRAAAAAAQFTHAHHAEDAAVEFVDRGDFAVSTSFRAHEPSAAIRA